MILFYLILAAGSGAVASAAAAAVVSRRKSLPIAVTAPPRHVRIIRPPYDWERDA